MQMRSSFGMVLTARNVAVQLWPIILVMLLVTCALPVLAQDTTYTDPAGQFTATIPAGWMDESTAEYGLFTKSGVSLYLLTIGDTDVQAGIDAALARFAPDLASASPNPLGDSALPNGTWTVVLYAPPSGEVGAVAAQSNGTATIILLETSDNLNALQAVQADVSAVNLGIKVEGVIASTAEPEAEAAALVSPSIPLAEGEVTFPEPTGPHAVGRVIYGWTDASREETFTPEQGDPRTLTIWIWYPAAPTGDAQTASYMTGGQSTLMQQLFGISSNNVRDHAYESAPVLTTESGYPVLVFSPGNGMNSVFYSSLLEDIASHGYVIVGIDHTYVGELLVTLPNGQVVPGSGVEENDDNFNTRVDDVRFVIDQLAQVNEGDATLKGSLDLARVGIFGHSFGGTTAVGACYADARCQGAIIMDWKLQGEVTEIGLPQPLMLMDSERISAEQSVHEMEIASGQTFPETAAANAVAAFGAIDVFRENTANMLLGKSSDAYRIILTGARHYTFSDVPLLATIQPALAVQVAGISLNAERGLRIASDYILAFFDTYLKGEPSLLLNGASDLYSEVTFRRGQS